MVTSITGYARGKEKKKKKGRKKKKAVTEFDDVRWTNAVCSLPCLACLSRHLISRNAGNPSQAPLCIGNSCPVFFKQRRALRERLLYEQRQISDKRCKTAARWRNVEYQILTNLLGCIPFI